MKEFFNKVVVWMFYFVLTITAIGIIGFFFWLDKLRFVY